MDKYFIAKGTKRKGPYSIDDLLKIELTDDYLIWKEGFEKWLPITEITELKSNIIITPPPTPAQLKQKNHLIAFDKSVKTCGICLLILWPAIFLVMGGYKNDYQLKDSYGYGEYAIYGEGSAIRQSLIWASLLISSVISAIILFFVYKDKTKLKIKIAASNAVIQTDEQIIAEHK